VFYQDCLQILASLDAAENRLMAHVNAPLRSATNCSPSPAG
jgi:hypothetical protein